MSKFVGAGSTYYAVDDKIKGFSNKILSTEDELELEKLRKSIKTIKPEQPWIQGAVTRINQLLKDTGPVIPLVSLK